LPSSARETIEFFRTGFLKREVPVYSHEKPGEFIAIPNRPHFVSHPLYNDLKENDWQGKIDSVLDKAACYAKLVGFAHKVNHDFNNPNVNFFSVYNKDREGIKQLVDDWNSRHIGNRLNEKYVLKMVDNARKRKGVLIGLNKKILSVPLELDEDRDICFFLREGISKKYVDAIVPLGNEERVIVDNYFLSKTKR